MDDEPRFMKLSYPYRYRYDVLRTLEYFATAKCDFGNKQKPALDWLASSRTAEGRWSGSSPFRQRTWASLGDDQETQRWVSLQTALVLKATKTAY